MECNTRIYLLINELTLNKKILFGLSNINRVIKIYRKYIDINISEINIDKYNTLILILNSIMIREDSNIQENNDEIKVLETFLSNDYYGSSVELAVSNYIITGIIAVLEFIKTNNIERIYWCSDCVIEILNQIEFEKYYSKYPKYSDDEIENLVDETITKEVIIQENMIKLIKEDVTDICLNQYIEENQIVVD